MKPYRDYACRIDRGRALLVLYQNFIKAWERADSKRKPDDRQQKISGFLLPLIDKRSSTSRLG